MRLCLQQLFRRSKSIGANNFSLKLKNEIAFGNSFLFCLFFMIHQVIHQHSSLWPRSTFRQFWFNSLYFLWTVVAFTQGWLKRFYSALAFIWPKTKAAWPVSLRWVYDDDAVGCVGPKCKEKEKKLKIFFSFMANLSIPLNERHNPMCCMCVAVFIKLLHSIYCAASRKLCVRFNVACCGCHFLWS